MPENPYGKGIHRGVREDGTVGGKVVETHILYSRYATIDIEDPPYLAIIMDGPGIDYEVRIKGDFVESMAKQFAAAHPAAPTMADALEDLIEALSRPVHSVAGETYFAEAHGLDDEYSAAVEALRVARGETNGA